MRRLTSPRAGWEAAARPAAAGLAAAIAAGVLSLIAVALGLPRWPMAAAAAASAGVVVWAMSRGGAREIEALEADLGGTLPAPEDAGGRLGAVRKQVRERMAERDRRERTLQGLLDGVDEPVLAVDRAGSVILCNHAAEGLIGRRAERILGRGAEEVFTQPELVNLALAGRAGRRVTERVRISQPDGVRVFDASTVPVALDGPEGSGQGRYGAVLTLRDVTELARAVQVKADFVANASHELRTPIAALRAAVETLAGEAADDPEMGRRLMGIIAGNTTRLEEMVRDLLDLSRLESPEAPVTVEPIPGSRLEERLTPLFERVCRERKLKLTFDLAPELEGLESDPRLLMLILSNLIENATKYAYEGTQVRVAGRSVPEEGGLAGVRLEVIDRGVGIPLDAQQRVFERYYQVDSARAGTAPRRGSGLGLAIVKHAVRTLGGSIRVNSVWKEGTAMIVELPSCIRIT